MKRPTLLFLLLFSTSILWSQIDSISPEQEASWQAAAQWDKVDEISTADIRKYTTEARYCTPMVSYIPEHATVPSPRDFLGHIIGAEGHLTRVADEYRYLEALAKASPRVKIEELGLSEEGRRMILLLIADEETLANLDQYRAYTAQLADPRTCDEKLATEISGKAKPIMTINGGLHSTETGPPEMLMELAYRLAVSEHPDIVDIRNNVITTIIPVMEPDGRDRVVDWYYRILKDYDDIEYMPDRSPPYWGSHAYHDNNRDGLQMTLRLTQTYDEMFYRWHPQYALDLHESVPLMYVSTGTGPYNEMIDPITVHEWQWAANWEIAELSKQGLPGVWTWGFYTGWNPGYLMWMTNNHNSMGRFYETFGNSVPKTMEREIDGRDAAGTRITERDWYRSTPPDKKVMWSLRNNTNYMQSGVLSSLTLLARNGKTFLFNFWKKGANSYHKGMDESPYGWYIPAGQAAKDRTSYLINQLQRHGIEVHRAMDNINLEKDTIQKGDFVVRLDQPYANFARTLLSDIIFPKEAKYRPYDDVSWTLGKVYRVDTHPIKDKAIFKATALEQLSGDVVLEAKKESGRVFVIPHDGSNSLIGLRYAIKGYPAYAADTAFTVDGKDFPAGSMIIRNDRGLEPLLTEAAKKAMVDVFAYRNMPAVSMHELDLPRVALYHTWTYTQPDGWVRYSLQQAGIEFDYINDEAIKAGKLRQKYDVIMVADQRGGFKRMVQGRDPKFGPQPFTTTDDFKSQGSIDASEDITGGIGFMGLANLQAFLNEGGTLMLFGGAGELATESGLLRNVSSRSGVTTPGSALTTMIMRPDHPITYGFPDVNYVFRINGPYYSVPEQYEHWIVMQYGTQIPERLEGKMKKPEGKGDKLLLTGFISGEQQLQKQGAILDIPRYEGGRVILYSFNPLHRHLNVGDQNYVFNAILNWNDFPEPKVDGPEGLKVD
ncbi:MAG: M14 family zinc carboxypeptidase [Saprospiraceae bacterium]|nr:hypothetical protein [Lewinella sp.]